MSDIERSQITKEELCGLCWKFRQVLRPWHDWACEPLAVDPCCRRLLLCIAHSALTCRFKRQAGEFWLSWDPYWTKSGPQMQRVFHEDGTVLGIPSHEPFWFQDSECRSAVSYPRALCAFCSSYGYAAEYLHQQMSHTDCRWRFTKSREGKRGGPFVKVNHWPSLVVSRQNGFGWRMEVRALAMQLTVALLDGATFYSAKLSQQQLSSPADVSNVTCIPLARAMLKLDSLCTGMPHAHFLSGTPCGE